MAVKTGIQSFQEVLDSRLRGKNRLIFKALEMHAAPGRRAVYFVIFVRSHMGKKIAMAKKPTTTASPTVRMGPTASDICLTA